MEREKNIIILVNLKFEGEYLNNKKWKGKGYILINIIKKK